MMNPNTKEEVMNYVYHIHFSLSSLTYYNNNMHTAEESMIEDWDFMGLIRNEWEINILSENTINHIEIFRKKWVAYKKNKNYSKDFIFNILDNDWNALIDGFLIPALDKMEKEMTINKISFSPYDSHRNLEALPSEIKILERVNFLYGLLLKHAIIDRSYLD